MDFFSAKKCYFLGMNGEGRRAVSVIKAVLGNWENTNKDFLPAIYIFFRKGNEKTSRGTF